MATNTLTTKQLANKLDHDGIYIHYGIIQGATSSDSDSQIIIGDLFYGKHQFQDAMDWYRLAAEKNDPKGQYKMGKMYQKGGGVAVDYKLAMDWYLKAAAQNNSKAIKAIGGLFENGLGVPVDSARANEWYNKGSKTSNLWFKKDKNKSLDGLVRDAQQFIKMESQAIQENSGSANQTAPKRDLENELRNKNQKITSLKSEVDTLQNSTDQMKERLECLERTVQKSVDQQEQNHKSDYIRVLEEKNREATQKVEVLEKLFQRTQLSKSHGNGKASEDNNDLYYISGSDSEDN